MNDWTISVKIENSHLIASLNGHSVLIDTGSPSSFGQGVIEWDGEAIDLGDRAIGVSLETLRKYVGLDCRD